MYFVKLTNMQHASNVRLKACGLFAFLAQLLSCEVSRFSVKVSRNIYKIQITSLHNILIAKLLTQCIVLSINAQASNSKTETAQKPPLQTLDSQWWELDGSFFWRRFRREIRPRLRWLFCAFSVPVLMWLIVELKRVKWWKWVWRLLRNSLDESVTFTSMALLKKLSRSKSKSKTAKIIAPNLSTVQTIQTSSSIVHSVMAPKNNKSEQIATTKLKAVVDENNRWWAM